MRSLQFFGAALLFGASSLGCGSGRDDMERRLSALRQELTALQAQNDRLAERVQAMEVRQATAQGKPTTKSGDATLERPPLKVIRLEPGEAAPSVALPAAGSSELKPEESPDDPTPRPVIRLRGKRDEETSRRDRPSERRVSQNESAASGRDGE